MKAVTAGEMRAIDKATGEVIGIPSIVLMENAAREVARVCIEEMKDISSPKVLIFAGRGNNGGDGFALARLLNDRNIECKLVFLFEKDKLTEDAGINYNAAVNSGIYIITDITEAVIETVRADVVVDAVFGTGLSREISGIYIDIINLINSYSKKVISVDIPSGVNSDDGRIMGIAVKADVTVTFALPKIGMSALSGCLVLRKNRNCEHINSAVND